MKKTLVYDLIKLKPSSYYPLVNENLAAATRISDFPTVAFTRDQFIQWSNNYKILCEFAAEVLGNKDFSLDDLLNWYRHEKSN